MFLDDGHGRSGDGLRWWKLDRYVWQHKRRRRDRGQRRQLRDGDIDGRLGYGWSRRLGYASLW